MSDDALKMYSVNIRYTMAQYTDMKICAYDAAQAEKIAHRLFEEKFKAPAEFNSAKAILLK